MWETIAAYLTKLGPSLGVLLVSVVALMYLVSVLVKAIIHKSTSYGEIHEKVASLYHRSLTNVGELREDLTECQTDIIRLKFQISELQLTLMNLRILLLRFQQNHPELNGDLDEMLTSIEYMINKIENN